MFVSRSRVCVLGAVQCSVYCTSRRLAQREKNLPPPAVEFLGGWDSPDVGQHQNERADYDDLQDLPVIPVRPIAAQSGHPWHQ